MNKVSPQGRRDDVPRRRWQFDPKIAANLRPSADGSAVRYLWWPAVVKLQAASVPTARQLRNGIVRRTDRAIPKCPLRWGIINNKTRTHARSSSEIAKKNNNDKKLTIAIITTSQERLCTVSQNVTLTWHV